MYRFALTMSPDDVEAVAAELYVEMLEAGFAAVAEFHYLHHAPDGSPYASRGGNGGPHRRGGATARASGLTLLPVFYAHATFGGAPPKPEQRRFINDVAAFARLVDDCRGLIKGAPGEALGVAPHSLRAVTPEELAQVVSIAEGAPIHIHAAEQIREVEDCVAALGAPPVRWLIDHAAVDDRWCLVHATHMDEEETRGLANSGAVAGLCPVTEANLGDGIFNGSEYIRAGGRYGIGSDSNVSIGVAQELRQFEYAQRLRERARSVLAAPGESSGRAMLDAALIGGARALARRSGRLAVGAVADMLSLSADHPTLAGKIDDQNSRCVDIQRRRRLVDCVWSGGRKVVANGRHRLRDQVGQKFKATMRRLCER